MGIIAIGLIFIVAAKPIVDFITGGALSSLSPGLESVSNTLQQHTDLRSVDWWCVSCLSIHIQCYKVLHFGLTKTICFFTLGSLGD